MSTMIRNCGISNSPTRTPLSHHQGRRRMTLGMLLRSPIDSSDHKSHPRQSLLRLGIVNNKKVIGRSTLKGLTSSTPKIFDSTIINDSHQAFVVQKRVAVESNTHQPPVMSGGGSRGRGGQRVRQGMSGLVTASTGFRIRILKRVWRPVLGAIPEGKFVGES